MFEKSLTVSGSGIMEKRAKTIATATEQESEKYILNLKRELNKLQSEEETLCDLGPEDNTSLRPASKDFNPEKWVAEMNRIVEEQDLLTIRLKIAEKIHARFFAKAPEESNG